MTRCSINNGYEENEPSCCCRGLLGDRRKAKCYSVSHVTGPGIMFQSSHCDSGCDTLLNTILRPLDFLGMPEAGDLSDLA